MALQSDFCLGLSSALNLCEDRSAFRLPAMRGGLQIVMSEVNVDGGDQLGNAGEAAFAHDVVGQLAKETFHEVEPRRAGGVK